jgi:hypothetical protein
MEAGSISGEELPFRTSLAYDKTPGVNATWKKPYNLHSRPLTVLQRFYTPFSCTLTDDGLFNARLFWRDSYNVL